MEDRFALRAVVLGILVTLLSPLASFGGDVTLKLAHIAPPGSMYDAAGAKLAERVAANTKGKIEIKIFGNSQLGVAPELWAQLRSGAIDLHVVDVGAVSTVEPDPKNLSILQAPYLFDSQAQCRSFIKSPLGQAMLAKVDTANNMKFLGYLGDSSARAFATTSKRVTTPEEMKGLKLRVAPFPVFVATYKAWGATPTPTSPKAIYTSVKSGMVDGMDLAILDLYFSKYYEIQKYFTAIDYAYSGLGCWISAKRWDSFDEETKAAVLKAVQETEVYMTGYVKNLHDEAEKAFKAAGVQVIHPDLTPWKELAVKAVKEFDGKLWEKGLYEKIRAAK